MARNVFMALACVMAVVTTAPPGRLTAGADEDSDLAATLAVQTAMRQGKDLYLSRRYPEAVAVLEKTLPYIKGNRAYLELLRDTYRAYIHDLAQTRQPALVQQYFRRLQILDPEAKLDAVASVVSPAGSPVGSVSPAAAPPAAQPAPKIRAKIEADAPPTTTIDEARAQTAREMVRKALEEFSQHRYREARMLFDEADHRDHRAVEESQAKECWAYCVLSHVVERLNETGGAKAPLPCAELEREVRTAMALAPRLETKYGTYLLGEIRKRQASEAAPAAAPPAVALAVSVRHGDRSQDGMFTAETANFVIRHGQSREFAEQAAQVAERTRSAMSLRWFGHVPADWSPKCELVLHANAADYSRATGVPGTSPGHSTIRTEAGRLLSRRIDLHCDDPNLLSAVLPHEATHVVLAGQFGEHLVPRWADEGIAVLSEPEERVQRHLRNLPEHNRTRSLFGVGRLMQMDNYPDARFIGPFYAESVSVVKFLSRLRGPQAVTEFLRDALQTGQYEAALARHFGIRDFDDLQRRWELYALADPLAVNSGE